MTTYRESLPTRPASRPIDSLAGRCGRDWRILAQRLIKARPVDGGLTNTVALDDDHALACRSFRGRTSAGGGEDGCSTCGATFRTCGKLHDVHAICSCRKPEPSTSWSGYDPAFMCCTKPGPSSACQANIDAHRVYSAPTDRSTGIICDQTISLDGFYTRQDYPELLRRIRFKDPESGKTLVFITNNFSLPAATICALYKSRWQVELFFKWIKQHLRIKQFYGTSENAVKTQIWIAVSLRPRRHRQEAPRPGRLALHFVTDPLGDEKMPIHQALAGDENRCNASQITNQLNLFDF